MSVIFELRKALSIAATVFFLCVSATVYAQFELRSATIITQTDTLLGQVKFYDWDITPTAIDFVNPSGVEQTFPARQIRQMVISPDKVYEGRQLAFTVYKEEESSISAALVGHPTSGYFLLESLLESGVVKLYRFFDNNKKARYFLEKEAIVYPLDNIETIIRIENKANAYDNPLFRTTLKQVLSECPTLNTADIPYTEKSIMNVLKEYHSYCRIDSRVYQEQKDVGKIKVSLGAIGSLYPFIVDKGAPIVYGQAYQIGVSMRLLMPQRFSNYFLIAELARIILPNANVSDPRTNLALYGGRYFGTGALQGLWYTGLSIALGPLDTGVGLSYKKSISVSASLPILYQLIAGFETVAPPTLNVRYHLPLTK